MENDGQKRISVHIVGTAMDNEKGYELKYLIKTLQNFEKISQKTYLYLTNQNKMSDKTSDDFKVYISDIRPGSFKADIIIFCNSYILPLVPVLTDHCDMIWECAVNSFKFLRDIAQAKSEGKTVKIINYGDNTVINTGDGVTNTQIVYPSYVSELGPELAKPFCEIADTIDDNITDVSFETDSEDITLNNKNATIFKKHTYLTEEIFEIVGKMTVSNSNNYKGKIKIMGDENFEEGEYNFELSNELKSQEILKKVFLKTVKYKCSKKVVFEPTNPLGEKIIGVKLLEVLQ